MPFLKFDNVSIRYEVWGDNRPESQWYTVFNGLGQDVEALRHLWDGNLGPGRRLLLFEPRGCGLSTSDGDFTLADLAEDTVRLWNVLGVHQSVCIAVCIGCNIALWLGAKVPHRIKRLHLMSPSPAWRFYASGFDDWLPDPTHTRERTEKLFWPGYQTHAPHLIDLCVKQTLQRMENTGFLLQTRRLRNAVLSAPIEEVLRSITIPVHILHGEQDAFIDPEASRFLASEIPHAHLTWLAGGGHCLMGPPALNSRPILDFVLGPEE